MPPENPTPAEQKIIDLLTRIAGPGDSEADKKEQRADQKRAAKRNLKALRDNGLALIGLSSGMLSLSKLVGNQLSANKSLAESLGQTAEASRGVASVTNRFIAGQQGFEQSVKLFADAVSMGMSDFSDRTLQFGMQLKVMGVQNKTSFQLIRANTQGLGMSEEATLMLTNQLVSTAIENKDSISGLIDAINGMKEAMVDTTVELGPKAALNAQKIAAMMAQGNSELQESSAKFVKSFLSGSDGFMKAAKLGVTFTGRESTAEMARKFETILENMSALQSGRQGAGSQFLFDALERSFGLSREDFNLQTQIGTSIKALKEANVKQFSRASAGINIQQQILETLEPIQKNIARLLQFMTSEFASWKPIIGDSFKSLMKNPKEYLLSLVDRAKEFAATEFPWLKTTLTSLLAVFTVGVAAKAFGALSKLGGALGLRGAGAGLAGMGSKLVGGLKSFGKGAFALAKKFPGTSAVIGTGFAINSLMQGNMADAGVHMAAGLMSTFAPGPGTVAATALEAGYHLTGAREAIMGNGGDVAKAAADSEEALELQRQQVGLQERQIDLMEKQAPIRGFKY